MGNRTAAVYAEQHSKSQFICTVMHGLTSFGVDQHSVHFKIFATSLMELMGGSFMLYVDGDLFKVVLGFAQIAEEKEPLNEDESGK